MQLLDTKQAAERLGVNPSRVRQLRIAGKLRGVKMGRDWFFTENEIEKFKTLVRPQGYPKGVPRKKSQKKII